jgi:SAM-dependent methyltransferase
MLYELRRRLLKLSTTKLKSGPHITRYAMYRRLSEVPLPITSGRVLAISESANLCELMSITATDLVDARYPQVSMLSLPYPDESFDFVLADQVLEHIAGDPFVAVAECNRVLRPGGVAVQTTCFVNPIHGHPHDYWRFTPNALRLLHEGWNVIECDGWGNFDAWWWINAGLRWEVVPHATWHPMHKAATRNDPAWPISTWVVASKH